MSDLAAAVVAGPGHPNSGYPSTVHVLGSLIVGHSGVWLFGPVAPPRGERRGMRSLRLRSHASDVLNEIRAGVGLALGLPESLAELPESLVGAKRWPELDLPGKTLAAIAGTTRDRGISLVVTVPGDNAILEQCQKAVQQRGWSTVVCGPVGEHLETQWD